MPRGRSQAPYIEMDVFLACVPALRLCIPSHLRTERIITVSNQLYMMCFKITGGKITSLLKVLLNSKVVILIKYNEFSDFYTMAVLKDSVPYQFSGCLKTMLHRVILQMHHCHYYHYHLLEIIYCA